MSKKNNNSGFTIIELLISCMVISVGFLSVMSMITNAFSQTMPLSSNLTASYLTQEGFEVVRRIRDTNFNELYSSGSTPDPNWYWTEGLIDEGVDSTTGSVYYGSTELGNNQINNLYVDSQGLFSYEDTGEENKTSFKREITLERKNYEYNDGVTTEYLLVTVEVSWLEKGNVKTHQASTKLFNWY